MFNLQPIGVIHSPYKDTASVPKGLGARHDAEGTLEILPEFEAGLTDIEGFSHLFVIWAFDRSHGFELIGRPPSDNKPHAQLVSSACLSVGFWCVPGGSEKSFPMALVLWPCSSSF